MENKWIKGTLTALDGKPITDRTGTNSVLGESIVVPTNDRLFLFMYLKEAYSGDSPGVSIYPENVEKIGNEYRFLDYAKRQFSLVVKED